MRLDARRGDGPYSVWHAEEMRYLKHVVWLDDDLHAWGEYVWPPVREGDHLMVRAMLAKRILIMPDRRLIVINPLEDDEFVETLQQVSVASENHR